MGFYYSTGKDGPTAKIMGPKCEDLGAGYASDLILGVCIAVTGQTIRIEDTTDSVMEGFEIMNIWNRCDGTQCACADVSQIEGPGK